MEEKTPTTTDANLVLGRIDPNSFVGGEIEPDWAAVDRAFEPLQDRLGIDREALARGVIRIANANMTNALRLVSTNKGYDPRDFALIAFGGGGAMHALALAEELKVPRVIVPVNSAVFSAWGMLLTDLRRDYLQTRPIPMETANARAVADTFAAMIAQAKEDYAAEGIPAPRITFEYHADMRYEGQEHTVKVTLPVQRPEEPFDVDESIARFHDAHEQRYTYRLDTGVQLVNFHLVSVVPVPKPELLPKPVTGRTLAQTSLPRRKVDFDNHGIHDAAIYDGLALEPGMTLTGPAVVQEPRGHARGRAGARSFRGRLWQLSRDNES